MRKTLGKWSLKLFLTQSSILRSLPSPPLVQFYDFTPKQANSEQRQTFVNVTILGPTEKT